MKDLFCSYEQGMFATEPAGPQDHLFFHQALAFHEAGHAVCGYALGFGCSRIVMSEQGDGARTHAACAYFSSRRAQRRVYAALRHGRYCPLLARHAIVCAAGAAAERRFGVEHGLALRTLSGAVDDHREIEAVCERVANVDGRSAPALRRMAWRQAQKLLAQTGVWRATQELAARLVVLLPPHEPADAARIYVTIEGPAARAIMKRAGVNPSDYPLQTDASRCPAHFEHPKSGSN